ncbi:MAG: RNA 2',3'-cyclic phosphodiesterase [Clostridia bacterium]|nr:RNA 2',3'-cyclic phosphodiesterase [Clostridia bacterium]
MRTFIALELPDKTLDYVDRTQEELSRYIEGNFVYSANMHITVDFLGEITPKMCQKAMEIIRSVSFSCYACDISLGRLMLYGKGVVVQEIKLNQALSSLKNALDILLKNEGFTLEDRPFKPHITLLRQATHTQNFNEIKKNIAIYNRPQSAQTLTLFLSDNSSGKYVYSPLERVTLLSNPAVIV